MKGYVARVHAVGTLCLPGLGSSISTALNATSVDASGVARATIVIRKQHRATTADVRLRDLLGGIGHEPCFGGIAWTRASVRRGTDEFRFGLDAFGDDALPSSTR